MDNKMDNQEEIRLRLVRPDTSTRTELPVATSGVSAGFPSPADDHLDPPLDLNRELVRNPGATFFARVAGDSMQDDGIADGDLLVVDKSLEAYDGCVAVCFLDGEFTLKRLRMGQGKIVLVPANKRYKPIEIGQESDFTVWGVVTYAIKKVLKRPPKRRNYLTPSNIPARERQRPGRGRRTTCNTKKRCTDFATAIISSPRASGSSAPNWKGCPWSCCRTTTAA